MNQRKTLTLFLLTTLLVSCLPLLVHAEASWLEGYGRRVLFYWESSAAGQDSFTVYNQTGINNNAKFYIYNDTKIDFSDLRVTLADGETLLPIWNQTTIEQASVKVWCNFPTANTTYYLYWNKPNAEPAWDTTVFNNIITGCVGAWPLMEATATNATDYSGNNNSGIVTGTSVINSPFNSGYFARNFTGASKLDMGNAAVLNFNATSSFSILTSFQTSYTAATQTIIRKGLAGANPSYLIRVDATSGKVTARIYDAAVQGVVTSASGYADGLPHTLLAVVNRTSQRITLYVDGVYAGISNDLTSIGTLSNTASFCMGSSSSSSDYFNGVMGNLFVFNQALNNFAVSGQFFDASIVTGQVFVRQSFGVSPVINLFGVVESAPVVEPTVDPNEITGEDALGVGVVFAFIVLGVCVALIFSRKK